MPMTHEGCGFFRKNTIVRHPRTAEGGASLSVKIEKLYVDARAPDIMDTIIQFMRLTSGL
jgi:hypothetical protein